MKNVNKYWFLIASLVITIPFWFAVACEDKKTDSQSAGQEKGPPASPGAPADLKVASELTGAGATFPFPLYSKWADAYGKEKGLKLNYQAIGSGGGVAQIKKKTVDFGASDEPMKPADLEKEGLFQFPMAIGGVVPVVNIDGIADGALKLSPSVLCGIYLGTITKWDHEEIKKLNEGLSLPARDIAVVYRSDGSGTTWIFTDYLGRVCPAWKDKVGVGKSVQWPVGMGGKGNPGVAAYVKQTGGAIGYVEFAFALQNKLPVAQLQNRAGMYVRPAIESFMAAAKNADWEKAPGFYMVLNDQPGDETWPIAGATFILIHREQADASKIRAIFGFFDWCYRSGAELAKKLHYVPMPESVFSLVQSRWESEISSGGKPVAWK
ncbi:phosphate ABC transporter substrate-binding protein PstS [Myxococcota bacterium]|nr:phosphate ABC transporter substrate-binding protein PstS [Myxococcota bacterium]MBU1410860.1 phosphate ABC transporter substrate-binding protein PstS [Myxococcota bacterium]MBU1509257.1 phosphate ABC transporter substrate-binding protein PstS [Myxococcota bacterium]